jgi:hypothetical protein
MSDYESESVESVESSEESSEPPKKAKKRAKDDSDEEDEDEDDTVGTEEAEAVVPVAANAPYGGSAVLQKIMARKSKWQFLGKNKKADASADVSEDEGSKKKGKGKGSKKGKKGSKSKKTTSKKGKGSKKGAKKDPDAVVTKRLEPLDMGYHEMQSHFMEHHEKTTEVETILDVYNPKTWARFEECRDKVAKKRPYLVRNNLLTLRMYHGTFLRCDLGLDGNTTPCKHPDCRVCQIIRKGFKLSKFGTGARKPADAKDLPGNARFGKGIYFADWASKAQEYSTAFATKAGKRGRTAVLACQVVVGNSKPLWEYDGTLKSPEKGYDSVRGETANVDHPFATLRFPETIVYNEDAAVVTQIFIYTHANPMCPQCGLQVDWDDFPTARVKDEYGWFCSELCNTTFKAEIEEFEATIRDTPQDLEEPSRMPFWDQTNSDENCDLIPLWPGSKEGTIIQIKMKKTLPNATIHKMFRVQNHFLHERYYQELLRVVARNGGQANESLVWHGTRSTPPDDIYDTDEGFDFRFAQAGMWGKGSYFAVNSSYSDNYAYQETNGYKTMFLAKVCLGDSTEIQPDSTLTLPPEKPEDTTKKGKKGKRPKRERYDSVTGNTYGSKVHIVYLPAKCYPAYLVTYSTGVSYGWNF